MTQGMGKVMILIGLGLVVLGILFYFFHDKLQWIGRLPGDIRVEREHFRLYIPITTMILASLVITVIMRLIQWISR